MHVGLHLANIKIMSTYQKIESNVRSVVELDLCFNEKR